MPTATSTDYEKQLWEQIRAAAKDDASEMYDRMMAGYSAANQAAFAQQQENQRIAENQFYQQLYDTNQTVLDSIRKNNAAAIASGASKGTQAANELSAMLLGQQESAAAATELAQSNYDIASEQQQAILESEAAARQDATSYATNIANATATAAQADAQKYATEYTDRMLEETFNSLAPVDGKAPSAQAIAAAKARLQAQGVDPAIIDEYLGSTLTDEQLEESGVKDTSTKQYDYAMRAVVPSYTDSGGNFEIKAPQGDFWVKAVGGSVAVPNRHQARYDAASVGQLFYLDGGLFVKTASGLRRASYQHGTAKYNPGEDTLKSNLKGTYYDLG